MRLGRSSTRETDDRDTDSLVCAERAGRDSRVVQNDRGGACSRGCDGRRVGRVARRREGGLARRTAVAVSVEEVRDRDRRRTLGEVRRKQLTRRRGRCEVEREGFAWTARSSERHLAVEDHAKTRADRHPDVLHRRPVVRCSDRDRIAGSARARDAAVPGTGRPVVPGGSDDECVECECAGNGPRGWAVVEGGVGLGHADDRNARRVEGVPVAVRVDRPLETGDQLVGSGVDGPPACDVSLPAGDPDREHRGVLRQP